jgi:transposase
VRDWVIRYNAAGPDRLKSRKAPGKPPILNDVQRQALAAQVEAGPIPGVHGVVRWRLIDLAQWIWDEFGLSISKQSLSQEMRALGFRKLSARPRHNGQKADDIADFKKLRLPPGRHHPNLAQGTPVELWWQDEARIGQQTKLTRRWAARGTRPSALGISADPQRGYSERSALRKARLPGSSCPRATLKPWACTSMR